MLLCPKCGRDTAVRTSVDDGRTVTRIRECKRCGNIFKTTEMIDSEMQNFLEIFSQIHKDSMQE